MQAHEKPLTLRDYEIANVAADLLLKGEPFTRIAKHCFDRGLSREQTKTFIRKLKHRLKTAPDTDSILDAYDMVSRSFLDPSQMLGRVLKLKLEQVRKGELGGIKK